MKIIRSGLLSGASEAKGLTVIIDVFRAFSVSCYLMANGAQRIYPVGTVDEAFLLKKEIPGLILIGERNERKCNGFDFGNSPTHIENIDFTGKKIVHTTSSGTRGIELAKNATECITGSFVNAGAIAGYIKHQNPEVVTLVAMGYEGLRPTQEDEFCAEYIEKILIGEKFDFPEMVEKLKVGDGARLLDPANHEHSPATDFDLCLDINKFKFVMKVSYDVKGRKYFEKITI